MTSHSVYRCFDASGRLLYVGSARDSFARMGQHATRSWWAPQVAEVKVEAYSTRLEARRIERQAICDENPRWNVLGRWASVRDSGDLAALSDYRRAFLELGNSTTCAGRSHLTTIDATILALGVAS